MDRTDQYPEVGSEDSSLVPPPGHKGEWPKKIRTLTAVELDRLTIDGDGRFYWDGRLVNYVQPQQTPDKSTDLDALAILDRAAAELSGQKIEDPSATDQQRPAAEVATPAEQQHHVEQTYAPVTIAPVAPAITEVTHAAPVVMPTLAPSYTRPEKVRVSLSPMQSIGVILVILGFLVGVAGVAASGFVAAHEWGCKAGMVKSYCPAPPPAPKPPANVDIPA